MHLVAGHIHWFARQLFLNTMWTTMHRNGFVSVVSASISPKRPETRLRIRFTVRMKCLYNLLIWNVSPNCGIPKLGEHTPRNPLPAEYEWNIFFFHSDSKFRWGHITIDMCAWNNREGEEKRNEWKEFGLRFCSLRRLLFRQVNNLYAQTRMTVHLYTDYENSCRYIIRCRKLSPLPFVDNGNNKMPLTSRTDDFVLLMHRLHLNFFFERKKHFSLLIQFQFIPVTWGMEISKEKWCCGSHKCTKPEAKSHTPNEKKKNE